MVIEERIEIHAPLAVVWDVFSKLEDWGEWNSVCLDCKPIEGNSISMGSCFSFTVRPYYLPIKIAPRVTRCEPGREVVWEGERFGVRARHRFTFEAVGESIRIVSVEEFSGAFLWLTTLLRIPERLHRLSRRLLEDIKRFAERPKVADLPSCPVSCDLSPSE